MKFRIICFAILVSVSPSGAQWLNYPTPGVPRTSTGQAHGLLATAAFGGVTIAAFKLAAVLRAGHRWHALAPVSTALGVAMAISLAGLIVSRSHPALRARFGVIERAFYVSAIAWFAVFAVACAG